MKHILEIKSKKGTGIINEEEKEKKRRSGLGFGISQGSGGESEDQEQVTEEVQKVSHQWTRDELETLLACTYQYARRIPDGLLCFGRHLRLDECGNGVVGGLSLVGCWLATWRPMTSYLLLPYLAVLDGGRNLTRYKKGTCLSGSSVVEYQYMCSVIRRREPNTHLASHLATQLLADWLCKNYTLISYINTHAYSACIHLPFFSPHSPTVLRLITNAAPSPCYT